MAKKAAVGPPAVPESGGGGKSSMGLYVCVSAVLLAVIAQYALVPGADAAAEPAACLVELYEEAAVDQPNWAAAEIFVD